MKYIMYKKNSVWIPTVYIILCVVYSLYEKIEISKKINKTLLIKKKKAFPTKYVFSITFTYHMTFFVVVADMYLLYHIPQNPYMTWCVVCTLYTYSAASYVFDIHFPLMVSFEFSNHLKHSNE